MDALGEDLDLQRTGDVAAQAGGEPELVVIAGAAVETDDERDVAEPLAERST
jgi:hypothetical protein